MENKRHTPVLLHEVLSYLAVRAGAKYIDATVGRGGHALAIVNKGGIVLGIDRDCKSLRQLQKAHAKLNIAGGSLKLIYGNFARIGKIAQKAAFTKVKGILFDLGLSSWQIEDAGRGFSYLKDEPLDMRIDSAGKMTAEVLLNHWPRNKLYEVFTKFGEEQHSWRIAGAIVGARPLKTTRQLRRAVEQAVGRERKTIKVLARIFQALRIQVNDELTALRQALPQALDLLAPEGRLLVVSFHSLEDRMVKQFFKLSAEANKGRVLTKRPVQPGAEEIRRNRRARTAKLRVFEKN